MNKIRVAIADDHKLIRQGIRALLQSKPHYEVIAEVSDGELALQMVEKENPDIVLMDIMMPTLNGLDACKQMKTRKLTSKVIMLSMHADTSYVIRALRNGAKGYLLKDDDLQEIDQAIQTVLDGKLYVSKKISADVFEALLKNEDEADIKESEQLTARERQILQMVAEGLTSIAIGEKLKISARTVETHRAHIMKKLHINSQAEMVRYAIKAGVIET